MLELLHSIIVGFIGLALFVCAVFGSSRGHRVRRVYSHVIFFFLLLVVTLYLLHIWVDFDLTDHPRDIGPIDIHVGRFIISFLVIITFSVLVAYRMKEDALDLILHVGLNIASSAMLYMSAQSFKQQDRTAWLVASVVFYVIFILYILREGMHPYIRNPALIRFLAFFVVSYITVYLFANIASPYHQDLMSFRAHEIIMSCTDIVTIICCSIPIVHYSWALTTPVHPAITPGTVAIIARQLGTELKLAQYFHTY